MFARRFVSATGRRPIDHVQALRIDRARTLIEVGDGPLDDVGFQVGYEDPASFRRLFRRTTGLSPAAYRRKFAGVTGPPPSDPVVGDRQQVLATAGATSAVVRCPELVTSDWIRPVANRRLPQYG